MLHVLRGWCLGVPPALFLMHRSAGACPPRSCACPSVCSSGAPAPDPRYGMQGRLRFSVGRGPVPRHASVEETALVGVRFSRRSNARGGQAPALRARGGVLFAMPRSGAGAPELRALGHANARGGQAPALRTNHGNRVNRVNPAPLPAFSSYIRRPAHNTPRRITA